MSLVWKLRELVALLVINFLLLHSHASNASDESIKLTRISDTDISMTIDGVLDESIWQTIPFKDDMVIVQPDTLADAPLETRTQFFYTDAGLYVGVWNQQDHAQLVSRLSSRDKYISRDGVSITLDPSGKGLYAYFFSVNLGGTLGDGTVIPERQYSSQWDGPWRGASSEHAEGWAAEYFIPWSMMSMPESDSNTREMGYSLMRTLASKNERWAYPPLSRREGVFLSKLQKIELENINPKQQFTFYPFAASTYNNVAKDHQDSHKAGFDLFWRPSTNLQLTATVNPDFGNVESDNVVVNLSSFETFFPEKRAFFLEGQEIFVTTPRARGSRYSSSSPTSLINTRRIGSAPKSTSSELFSRAYQKHFPGTDEELYDVGDFELTSTERNQPSELIGALKVTGQKNKFRYGVLAAFEDDTKLEGLLDGSEFEVIQDGREFGIARFLYEDTETGNRRSIGWISTLVSHPQENAVVHGVDGHYLTEDGRWNTDAQLLYSNVDSKTGAGGFFDVTYTPKRGSSHKLSFDYFDDSLDISDFGFLRRNDVVGLKYSYNLNEYNLHKYKSRYTWLSLAQEYNTDFRSTRSGIFFMQDMELKNNASWSYDINYFPSRWEDRDSLGYGDYRVDGRWQAGISARTDRSRKLMARLGFSYLQEDIDGGYTVDYKLEFDWRPTDRFALVFKLNYEDSKGWLIHDEGRDFTTFNATNWRPKIEMDLFLTAKQQFRITAQWAGIKAFEDKRWQVPLGDGSLDQVTRDPVDDLRDFSISRLTFQARYRWELAPLSDLFVVYTRGSNLGSRPDDGFGDLLRDSWTDRLVDVFVVKLRYRMGG